MKIFKIFSTFALLLLAFSSLPAAENENVCECKFDAPQNMVYVMYAPTTGDMSEIFLGHHYQKCKWISDSSLGYSGYHQHDDYVFQVTLNQNIYRTFLHSEHSQYYAGIGYKITFYKEKWDSWKRANKTTAPSITFGKNIKMGDSHLLCEIKYYPISFIHNHSQRKHRVDFLIGIGI